MHRPLPCQDVVLASYMQIVGGHLLPAGHKESASEETLHTIMGKLDIDAVVNLMLQPTYNVVCVSDAKSKEFFLLFGACQ